MDSPAATPRLLLLGVPAAQLSGGASSAITSRRRLLALVALLATAGRAGVSRDRLYASLWPDSDSERASSSLRQAVFAVRKEFGGDVLTGDAVILRINPDAISVDLWEFEQAVDEKRWADAARLYRGTFLEGLNVRGLPELERQFEAERARLARQALHAVENVAEGAAVEGRHADAVAAWRRAVQIDPLGTKGALGLLKALVDAGDRTGALEYGRIYELLVRAELDGEPDSSITRLLTRLRRGSGQTASADLTITGEGQAVSTSPSRAGRSTPSAGAAAVRRRVTPTEGQPATGGSAGDGAARRSSGRQPAQDASARRRPSLVVMGVFASVVLSIAAVTLAWLSGGARDASADQANRAETVVAVLPFQVSGSLSSTFSATVAELVGAGLHGLGSVEVIPLATIVAADPAESANGSSTARLAAARRLGATAVVSGAAAESGGRLRLTATFDSGSGATKRASTEGPVESLLDLVDQLIREIAAVRFDSPTDRMKEAAARSTSSVPALRAFLTGEALLGQDRTGEAIDAFGAAILHDSTFALAYHRLSVAADHSGRDSLAAWASRRAIDFSSQLSERHGRLISAYAAARDGQLRRAELLYADMVADYPDDAEAWLELAQLQFNSAPLGGQPVSVARPAFERVVALSPNNAEALIYLARIAALEGRETTAQALLRQARQHTRATPSLDLKVIRAFALNDGAARKRVTRALLAAGTVGTLDPGLLDVIGSSHDISGIEAFAGRLATADLPALRGLGRRLLGQMALARGQWTVASVEYRDARFDSPEPALEQHAVLATLPFTPVASAELDAIRDALLHWDTDQADIEPIHNHNHRGIHAAVRLHLLGLVDVRAGDTSSLIKRVHELSTLKFSGAYQEQLARTLAFSLAARVEDLRGRPAIALVMLDSANWREAASVFEAEAADRLLRAMLLEKLGRRDEAIRWYSVMSQRAAYELVYLAPAQARLAKLHAERRDQENARRASQLAAMLWKDADPAIRTMVAAAPMR